MPSCMTDAVLVAVVTGLLGLVSGRMSMHGQVQAATIQAAAQERKLIAAPYEALAQRVAQLEAETIEQRSEITDLRMQLSTMSEEYSRSKRMWYNRDRAWQAGWDKLRKQWLKYRQVEEPPMYPVSKLDYNSEV